jgi:hypothetical protein
MNYKSEIISRHTFLGCSVSIFIKRDIWFDVNGIDEKFVHWGASDIDFHFRLSKKYRWGDLEFHDLRMYHLEHYSERVDHEKENPRKIEPIIIPNEFAPNPDNWGLKDDKLACVDGYGLAVNDYTGNIFDTEKIKSVHDILKENFYYHDIEKKFSYKDLYQNRNLSILKKIIYCNQPRKICKIGDWFCNNVGLFASFPYIEEVYCISHFDRYKVRKYLSNKVNTELVNNLYEQFIANCIHKSLIDKIFPVRLDFIEGIDYCIKHGIKFDLIYIDRENDFYILKQVLPKLYSLLLDNGLLCGNGWSYQPDSDNEAADAIVSIAKEKRCKLLYYDDFWILVSGELPFLKELKDGVKFIEDIKENYKRSKLLRVKITLLNKFTRLVNLHREKINIRYQRWYFELSTFYKKVRSHNVYFRYAYNRLYELFKYDKTKPY